MIRLLRSLANIYRLAYFTEHEEQQPQQPAPEPPNKALQSKPATCVLYGCARNGECIHHLGEMHHSGWTRWHPTRSIRHTQQPIWCTAGPSQHTKHPIHRTEWRHAFVMRGNNETTLQTLPPQRHVACRRGESTQSHRRPTDNAEWRRRRVRRRDALPANQTTRPALQPQPPCQPRAAGTRRRVTPAAAAGRQSRAAPAPCAPP